MSPQTATARRRSAVLPVEAKAVRWSRGGRALIDVAEITLAESEGPTLILGPNGAGKSVLLRLLAGLLVPDAGSVTWAGSPPDRARTALIGFVFQKPVLLRRSVIENLEYVLRLACPPPNNRRALAERALETAGLAHLARSPARLLSGGEQQRVALARALVALPEILMLDEPTANLDPPSTAAIEASLLRAAGSGVRVVMVTQDVGQARRLATDVVFMHRGRILERTPAEQFFRETATAEARAFLRGEIVL